MHPAISKTIAETQKSSNNLLILLPPLTFRSKPTAKQDRKIPAPRGCLFTVGTKTSDYTPYKAPNRLLGRVPTVNPILGGVARSAGVRALLRKTELSWVDFCTSDSHVKPQTATVIWIYVSLHVTRRTESSIKWELLEEAFVVLPRYPWTSMYTIWTSLTKEAEIFRPSKVK